MALPAKKPNAKVSPKKKPTKQQQVPTEAEEPQEGTDITPEELEELKTLISQLSPEEAEQVIAQLPPEIAELVQQSDIDTGEPSPEQQGMENPEEIPSEEAEAVAAKDIGIAVPGSPTDPNALSPEEQMAAGQDPSQMGQADPSQMQGMTPEEMQAQGVDPSQADPSMMEPEAPLIPSVLKSNYKIPNHTSDGFPVPMQGGKFGVDGGLQDGGTPLKGNVPKPDWWDTTDNEDVSEENHSKNISGIKTKRRQKKGLPA